MAKEDFQSKTNKLAEAFITKWNDRTQNSSASTFFWKCLKTNRFFPQHNVEGLLNSCPRVGEYLLGWACNRKNYWFVLFVGLLFPSPGGQTSPTCFFTKSVRFRFPELSPELLGSKSRDLAIKNGFRACFEKDKRKSKDFHTCWEWTNEKIKICDEIGKI